jgi:Carbohydrate esterase, sialic acid-specific acetylesterase/Secretion system C-terminal sorting domain
MCRRCKLFLLLSFVYLNTFAQTQIQVTFPANRIVLQRDNQNKASVSIAGNFNDLLERIEARFVPIVNGQGVETPWTTIQNNPTNGIFNGSMQILAGWYRLEVRGFLYGTIYGSTSVDRVGVGEVFVVAGQSNAQGDNLYPGATTGAIDDRVSTIDYYNTILDENALPFQFSQLGNDKKVSPYNYVPWFWARLGDLLAKRLNVPILFYGASLGGISTDYWRRSAAGEDLRFEKPIFIAAAGMPYRALKATLQQYATRTGIRAVLWQQGESDDINSTTTYVNNMKFVIDKIRQDSRKPDLAWVIARSSLNPTYHQNVIDAQNQLIQQVSNVFEGPNTDNINQYLDRYDGIHFMSNGLDKAATLWDLSLNDNFLNISKPLSPSPTLPISLSCNSNFENLFSLNTSGGYSSYNWSTGAFGTPSINVGTGTFSVKATDNFGNTYYSQQITIANQPTKPTISANRSPNLCQGESITLVASKNYNVIWNTGDQKGTIEVKNSGNYTVTNYSLYGCAYVSDVYKVVVNPLPSTSITTSGPTTFCPIDSVTLTASGNNLNFIWNTGSTKNKIVVKQTGNYAIKVKDNNGCESLPSSVVVNVRNAPTNNIIADGVTTFCLGKSVNLAATNDKVSTYIWSTGDKTKQISVKLGGNYTLKVKDEFGCESSQSSIVVTTLALPQTNIVINGETVFCSGGNVKLSSSTEKVNYIWNTGETSKDILVKDSGNYTLKVRDNNGCESPSTSTEVSVKPLPATPIINQKSTYFLEAQSSGSYSNPVGEIFEWKQDNNLLNVNTQIIKVNKSSFFVVRALIKYPSINNSSLSCFSPNAAPFSFVIPSEDKGLTVYPNPTKDGKIFIETKDDYSSIQLTLFTLKGQSVFNATITNLKQTQTLDLRDLEKGLYILQIKSSSFTQQRRILLDY